MSNPTVANRSADICVLFADPRCVVPPAEPGGLPGTLTWLRASVSRFCGGSDHDRRRSLVERDLERMDPDRLRAAARERALAELRRAGPAPLDVMARLARPVPVAVLGAELGVARPDLDLLVEAVATVAAAYHPGTGSDERRADAAVGRLVRLLGAEPTEAAANRIALPVQACDATARLICATLRVGLRLPPGCTERWPVEALVAETLRHDPPARSARRQRDGATLLLDLASANRDPAVFDDPHRFDPGRPAGLHLSYGHGPRACPGAAQATALACGVVEAVLPGATLAGEEPLEVTIR